MTGEHGWLSEHKLQSLRTVDAGGKLRCLNGFNLCFSETREGILGHRSPAKARELGAASRGASSTTGVLRRSADLQSRRSGLPTTTTTSTTACVRLLTPEQPDGVEAFASHADRAARISWDQRAASDPRESSGAHDQRPGRRPDHHDARQPVRVAPQTLADAGQCRRCGVSADMYASSAPSRPSCATTCIAITRCCA